MKRRSHIAVGAGWARVLGAWPCMRLAAALRAERRLGLAVGLALLLGAVPQGVAADASAAERPSADASAACIDSAVDRIQARYDAVRDLRAGFVQRTQRVALGAASAPALESRGEVVLAKPGRMRWSYLEPEPSLVVSDGEILWLYDPEEREVQRLALGPEFLSGAAFQLLLGGARLRDEFEISATACDGGEVVLELRPREDATFERLELRAERDSGEVRETTVVDLFGNRTAVTLESVEFDTDPEEALFEFDPPEGTRVITLSPVPQ